MSGLNVNSAEVVVVTAEPYGYCVLHWAAYFDDINSFESLLFDERSQLTGKSKNGNTTLHISASQNSLRVLRRIISEFKVRNISVDQRNNWNETPLHMAVAACCESAVMELITNGASLNCQDAWGRTPYRVCNKIFIFISKFSIFHQV